MQAPEPAETYRLRRHLIRRQGSGTGESVVEGRCAPDPADPPSSGAWVWYEEDSDWELEAFSTINRESVGVIYPISSAWTLGTADKTQAEPHGWRTFRGASAPGSPPLRPSAALSIRPFRYT